MMAGERLYRAWVRVPYLAAMPHLLTTRGPYAKVMIEAERLVAAGLATASVMGGFPYLDTPYNGVCVYAASRSDPREAVAAATRLAGEAWAMREAVRADWLDIAEATLLAVANNDPARPTIVLADIADNPGAGARGNTTGILRSLVNNAARGVVFGPFWDPDLAEAAHRCGVGGHLSANFDRPTTGTFDEPWSVDAAVMGLSDGKIPVRGGVAEGMTLDHGRSAALDLGGISVLVVSKAYQAFSPSQFEAVGLSVEAARTVVLKSRGHFRAAFEPLIPAERIFEVAAPGAISPMIAAFPYRNIQRPIWPLDPKFMWHPEDDVMCATPDHRWTRLAEVA
jgi:microcystin degradation protein MlrC